MAEYQVRKLYNVSTSVGTSSETYESLWAYYIRYPKSESNLPGRFRIRITRMTAEEFIQLMGMDTASVEATSGYSIQAYLEKWSDKGWLQCLDWIGAPDSTNDEIEADLTEMYKAFTTGQPANIKDVDPFSGPPTTPPRKPTLVKDNPVIKLPDSDDTAPNSSSPPVDDTPDFDWI